MPIVNMAKTGENIKVLLTNKGITVADLQEKMGFNTPQAIYKWIRGLTLPTVDNLVLLAHILDTDLDKIIVTKMV